MALDIELYRRNIYMPARRGTQDLRRISVIDIHPEGASQTLLGIKTGDRVAIVLPNIPQCVIAFYDALKAGAVIVFGDPRSDKALSARYAHRLSGSPS